MPPAGFPGASGELRHKLPYTAFVPACCRLVWAPLQHAEHGPVTAQGLKHILHALIVFLVKVCSTCSAAAEQKDSHLEILACSAWVPCLVPACT